MRGGLPGWRAHLRGPEGQAESDQPVRSQQPRTGAQTRVRQCSECLLRRYRSGGDLVEPLVHAAPFTGYVYPNETIIPWGILIVVYPYLTGLVAGSFTVSSLYQVFGFQRLKPVAHLALLVSLCCMVVVP